MTLSNTLPLLIIFGLVLRYTTLFPRLLGICLVRAFFTTRRSADRAAAGPVKALGNIFFII